jgi:hypothetical protein
VSTLLAIVHPGQHLPCRFVGVYLNKTRLVKEARGTLSGFDLAKLVGIYLNMNESYCGEESSRSTFSK